MCTEKPSPAPVESAVLRAPDDDMEQDCQRPCPPMEACDECAGYWERMRYEGYWKDGSGWTDKGWREITK